MELVTLGIGYIVNVLAKNQEVKDTVDEFISTSAKWIKSWFSKSNKDDLVTKLEATDNVEEVKEELGTAVSDMMKDDKFRMEFEKWVDEYKKPMPSMKNVIEDLELNVEGNINIGDSGGDQRAIDNKNIIKKSKLTGGGDFNLGDIN